MPVAAWYFRSTPAVAHRDGDRHGRSICANCAALRRRGVDVVAARFERCRPSNRVVSRRSRLTCPLNASTSRPASSVSPRAHRALADRRHGARRPRPSTWTRRRRRCRPYVDAGLTTFDMADHYGSAEDVAGRLSRRARAAAARAAADQVGAQARPGHPRGRTRRRHPIAHRASAPSASICCSSTPGPTPIRAGSTRCSFLQELSDEGLIAHLGLHQHRYRPSEHALASGLPIVSNQVAFSLLDRRAAGRNVGRCARRTACGSSPTAPSPADG